MKIDTGECTAYHFMCFEVVVVSCLLTWAALNWGDESFTLIIIFFWIMMVWAVIRLACEIVILRNIGLSKLYIDYQGVRVTYLKKVVFDATWSEIAEIGTYVDDSSTVYGTIVYFSRNPCSFLAGMTKRKQYLKTFLYAKFTKDFVCCSVPWRGYVPEMLEFVPEDKPINRINGRLVLSGDKWKRVPY